ncbi:unnamed protein product [Lathyrus sativus]|nr:unnamed protein product [Lathyrus sativus]
MRAALMWTINNFLVYGMFSGWGTHGKMGRPHCMGHTKAFTLQMGGKSSWNSFSDLPKFIDNGKTCRIPGYGDTHSWTKRSKKKDNEKARKDLELLCN